MKLGYYTFASLQCHTECVFDILTCSCILVKYIKYTGQVQIQIQIQILYFSGQIQIRASLYFKYKYVFDPIFDVHNPLQGSGWKSRPVTMSTQMMLLFCITRQEGK